MNRYDKERTSNVYTMSGAQYLSQTINAAKSEKEFFRKLKEEGWIYNGVLDQWTHPSKPGIIIER